MQTAVFYFSRTGHSRTIAQAVGEALGVPVIDAQKTTLPDQVDLLLVVSGIYAGKTDPALLRCVEELGKGRVAQAALITSSMGRKPAAALRSTLTAQGIAVQPEEYTCMGSFLFFGRGHPNRAEVEGAAAFARQALQQAAR